MITAQTGGFSLKFQAKLKEREEMKTIYTIVVVCLMFVSGVNAQSLTRLPTKAEYVHSFSKHGHGLNYTDLFHQFGKVAISGDIYGLHHGTIGAVSVTLPMQVGPAKISPGLVAILGRYETGPGFATRWEVCKAVFCTEGTVGVYHPLDGRSFQFLGDPIDGELSPFRLRGPKRLKDFRIGYSGEFGRYGKYGVLTDRIHGIQGKFPVSQRNTLIFSYVPGHQIWRAGVSLTLGKTTE